MQFRLYIINYTHHKIVYYFCFVHLDTFSHANHLFIRLLLDFGLYIALRSHMLFFVLPESILAILAIFLDFLSGFFLGKL